MASRLAVIVIGDVNPPKVADFWCKVLDWRVLEQESGFITIGPPDGAWPSIDVVPVPEGKAGKKRLHFDLRAGPGRPGLTSGGGCGGRRSPRRHRSAVRLRSRKKRTQERSVQ
ncbi:VOC family protein [Arthrobacter crystallopoietes]|uniref:VOC family protein n=1 Tax=Crystallibacter crystallopoietes TaxID=37928 RepID=UPI003D1D6D7F